MPVLPALNHKALWARCGLKACSFPCTRPHLHCSQLHADLVPVFDRIFHQLHGVSSPKFTGKSGADVTGFPTS